jgi:hypothetical protein
MLQSFQSTLCCFMRQSALLSDFCPAVCRSGVALSGLLAVLTACQDLKSTIGAKHHYLLYCLATAMKPRMLLTVDNEGQLLSVPVRVGQAVDVVAQAGRPKTITGGMMALRCALPIALSVVYPYMRFVVIAVPNFCHFNMCIQQTSQYSQ